MSVDNDHALSDLLRFSEAYSTPEPFGTQATRLPSRRRHDTLVSKAVETW